MQIEDVGLGEAKLIKLDRYEDYRGSYTETYNQDIYKHFGINFIQDDVSVSRRDVLRGLHGDDHTWKLISCPYGKIYFVILDCNIDSKTFGQQKSFILSGENALQVLCPSKFANGHLVISDEAVFSYKQSSEYDKNSQFTISWIWGNFPCSDPILSYRDRVKAISLYEYELSQRNKK
jgi:dTDP-4-dehydrorhamnose 3,5-epimerase